MRLLSLIRFIVVAGFLLSANCQIAFAQGNTYYISTSGNDSNDGSFQHPWKTANRLHNAQLSPGDHVYMQSGYTCTGTLYLRHISGTQNMPVFISVYGNNDAVFNAKDSAALVIDSCSHLFVNHIRAVGSGRKNGNVTDGIVVKNSNYINLSNINVSGFQKSGLLISNSTNVEAKTVYAHDNGFAGIFISGEYGDKRHCKNISLINCRAENNPGDPTNFSNHSGNGILAGSSTNILIDSCIATNNGWDMPRKGNGPVGIWCYEADSVTIQHCTSYQNKTSPGAEDGGGFDLDGGTTNSVIQYCLSYGNAGSAFGIFQYDGASPWHDNTIRYCISENDGNGSPAHANVYVWNSSHDSLQFKNLLFYNNTLYNDANAVMAYSTESDRSNFRFYNNIFMADKTLLTGEYGNDMFLANDWWSLQNGFTIDTITNFERWAKQCGKEQIHDTLQELNVKPLFKKPGNASVSHSSQLSSFTNYQLQKTSPLSRAGIDLQRLFGIDTGEVDFNNLPKKSNGIGACLK